MKTRSLLYRYLTSLMLVMLVFLVTVAVALFLGVNRGLELWKQTQGQSIQEFVSTELIDIYQFSRLNDGESVEEFLLPFLDPSLYLVVFNENRELIFWYWNGDSWYLEDSIPEQEIAEQANEALLSAMEDTSLFPRIDPESPHRDPDLFEKLFGQGLLVAVPAEQRTVAWFFAGSNGFTVTRENKQLVDSMVLAVLLGLVAAAVTGSAVSVIQVRTVGDHAVRVAQTLHNLAEGNKNQVFPESQIDELQSIVYSASILQRRLREEEELRRQWALDIAHDLRTPLSGLRVQIEGLVDGVLEPTEERFRRILAELARVEELSNSFLLLTRVESPEIEIEENACPIAQFAQAVRDRFVDRVEGLGRRFVLDTGPGEIYGDQYLLNRALSNVIENSIVHGAGSIFVSIASQEITVCNEGHIPEEDLPHLFDRLFQGNRQRSGTGNGLGLSITRAIVTKHGGTIELENRGNQVCATISLSRPVSEKSPI